MAERTNKPIDVSTDGRGTLFKDSPDELRGAMRIDGETFQFASKVDTSKSGKRFFKIVGDGEYGDSIDGALFEREPGVTAGGKNKPVLGGEIKTKNNKGEYDIAVWEETSAKGNKWYSMKVEPKREPAAQGA